MIKILFFIIFILISFANVNANENNTAQIGNMVSKLELSDSLKRRRILFGIFEIEPLICSESTLLILVLALSTNVLTGASSESPLPLFAMSLHTRRETTYLQPLGKPVQ